MAARVGRAGNLDLLLDDIRGELSAQPYEIVAVAGGYQFRTRPGLGAAVRAAGSVDDPRPDLSRAELEALLGIAYYQPVTRAGLGLILGREIPPGNPGRAARRRPALQSRRAGPSAHT